MRSRSRSHSGFTLSELLVIIAVIALLLAIISAALPMGLSVAREIKCKANLRHIGQAYNHMRAQQVLQPTILFSPETWSEDLLPYLGDNVPTLLCPDDEEYTSTGLPPARTRINNGGTVLYEVDLFGVYPYWREGSHADFRYKPAIWRVNGDVYDAMGINHSAGFGGSPGFSYDPRSNQLPKYTPGSDQNLFWYLMEDQRSGAGGGGTTGDGSLNDLHVKIEQFPKTRYDCTFYKDPASSYHCDLLLGRDAWIDPKDEAYETSEDEIASIGRNGNNGPYALRGLGILSYGMNSQANEIDRGSSKVLALDYDARVCYTRSSVGIDKGWSLLNAPRHRNRLNVLMAHGGVTLMDPDEINPDLTGPNAAYWTPPSRGGD
mgnify:CR=1 FL=1